jgi:hypothetical protein
LIYCLFNILWGLNYERKGIIHQMGIEKVKVKPDDIRNLMSVLVRKVNEWDSLSQARMISPPAVDDVLQGAARSYGSLSSQDPRFLYSPVSLKSSLFSSIGNYLGYSGYYNPITGEAQVNTTVPSFMQPYTGCHEIGHQLGYARENEANFAGYLAARSSTDPAFRYSVYFDLYNYGRPFLKEMDSVLMRKLDAALHERVRKDREELRLFYERHQNPVEAFIDWAYGRYLEANGQPDGKWTYNKVIVWLAAYYKIKGDV